jgi:hypothetical protein
MTDDSDARGRAVEALLEFKAAELKYRQLGLEEVHRSVRWGLGIAIGGLVLYQLVAHRPWLRPDLAERLQQRLQVSGALQKQQRGDDVRACGRALQALADDLQKPAPDPPARAEAFAIVRDRCNPTFE